MTGYSWSRLLSLLAVPDRHSLANRFGIPPEVEALTRYFTQSEGTLARIEALSAEAQDLLGRCWLAGSQVPLDALFRLPPALQPAIAEVTRAGLTVEVRVDYYNRMLTLPLEVQEVVYPTLVIPRLGRIWVGESRPASPLPAAPPWSTDLFRLLSHLRWQGGALTQQGELFKRSRSALEAALRPDPDGDPSQRFDQLLSFAEWAELITVDRLARRIDVTTAAGAFWTLTPAERWARWYGYWEAAGLSRIQYGHVVWDVLRADPGGRLASLDTLAELMAATGLVPLMRARHSLDEVVRHGIRLGWVTPSRDRSQAGLSPAALAFRAGHVDDAPPTRAVVQPTGEVIVPLETPPGIVWDAESSLSLQKADVVWTYRLDAAALDRALSEHLSPDEVLTRLSRLSRTPLPENLTTHIRETWRKMGHVRVLSTSIVWSHSRVQADTLAKGLGDLVVERLGDTVLVLSPDAGPQAIKKILKLGYPVRSKPEQPGAEAPRLVEPRPPQYAYRPPLQVSLLSVPEGRATANPQEILLSLTEALRAHETVRVSYCPTGWTQAVHATVYPVAVHGGVLHGVLQDDTRQSFQLPVAQILEVWRYS